MKLGDGHLTVLLPVRNAERLLPGWLASVGSYADAVVALDDGSTDRTRMILEGHPLVTTVLTNPVRSSYHGWDDLENRQRLVDAARDGGARWVLFLDADEHIDHPDGQALRRFLETEAQPGFAYGLEVFRMVNDEHHYDPLALWVFRLFSALDAATPLGSQRLHFVPVPSGIPRQRWLFTSIRIQHSGSLTASHRRARFDKYRQADPDNDFQEDYTRLLADPDVVAAWPERSPDLPVLLGTEGRYVDRLGEIAEQGWPAITAVVIAQNDEAVIDRSVEALVSQQVDEDFEIIVVCSGTDGTYARVKHGHPTVRCVQLPERALPGEARNAGLWMAGGEYVTFPGSHVWLMPGSLQARLHAHDNGWDLVTAAVVNGNTTPVGWASYLLDHAAQVPSRASGEYRGVPGHASYATRDVRGVGGFPEDMRAGEDTVVNRKLFYAGKRTYFSAQTQFAHASPSTTVAHLLRHHFQRGRALGRIIRNSNDRSTFARLRSAMSLPARRLRYLNAALDEADDELRSQYHRVRALVRLGALAAAAGTWYQLVARDTTTHPQSRNVAPSEVSGPVLVLSGRPGEAATGLLSAGTATQTTSRLMTFTRYAQSVCPVRPALAPIVTSATVTAEHNGDYTINLPPSIVDTYLRAARDVGAALLLQVQPGRAPLTTIIERWEEQLAEPDVGMYLDLRSEVALANQRDELDDAVALVRKISRGDPIILVRGATDSNTPDTIAVPDVLDLRRPGTPFPHEALTAEPSTHVLVFQ